MKTIFTILIIIILLVTGSAYGQLATYTGSGGTSTAVTAGSVNETVTVLQNTGFGSNTPCTSGGLSGKTVPNTWTAYNIAGPHYFIKITPNTGYQLNVTGFSAGMRVSGTGPTKVRYAYSLDNGVTWTDDGTDHSLSNPGCGNSVASSWSGGTLPTGITSTTNGIIVALFPYAPSSSSGTFQTNYINILGTVTNGCTPPTIAVTPSAPSYCAGGAGVSITATGAGTTGTYSWSPAIGLSATTGDIVTANPAAATTYTITGYSAPTCSNTTTVTVNIDPLPTVAPIIGTSVVCAGGATISLTNATSSGTWGLTNTSLATINSSGLLTGINAGTDTVTYAVTNTCGTTTVLYPITINPLPLAGAITGVDSVCAGTSITLSSSVSGGTWSSGNISVATVSAGTVFGVSAGSTTISYGVSNSCGTDIAVHSVVINPLPFAGTITGLDSVCSGTTISLTNTTTGGTWISSNSSIASISTTGAVTGTSTVLATATISYTVNTFSCGSIATTHSITVNPLPYAGNITGADSVCYGATISLSNTASGGIWSSANTAIASVSATGEVTGTSATLATTTISYTASTFSCGSATATHPVIIKPLPYAGTITGLDSVCSGATITLTNATTGGTWSSSNSSIASVSATGIVTGITTVSATATISYTTSTFSCGSIAATHNITVKPLPDAGNITGADSICYGATISLSNTASGGIWTSVNTAIASVSATGAVTGTSATLATTTISYTANTFSCGAASTSHPVTVKPLPFAGTITGLDSVCSGTTITLTNATTGGVWSSSNNSIASVSATGIVTGASTVLATATISYTVSTFSCGSSSAIHLITVKPQPFAGTISGNRTLCTNTTTLLTNTVTGGYWSSSNAAIATVSSGNLFAINEGNTIISYTVTNSCGTAIDTQMIHVNTTPPAITGATPLCAGVSLVLHDDQPDGEWISSNTAVATIDAAGETYGVAVGTTTITYLDLPTGCFTTTLLNVNPSISPSISISTSTPTEICQGTSVTYTANPLNGGTSPLYVWSVNGVILAGSSSYTYTPANGDLIRCWILSSLGCAVPDSASATVSMNVHTPATPSLTLTTGTGDTICYGALTTITPVPVDGGTAPSYNWFVNLTPAGTGNTLTYTPSNGDIITCQITSNEFCFAGPDTASASTILTVTPLLIPSVTTSVSPGVIACQGYPVNYIASQVNGGTSPSYVWSVNGSNTATGNTFTYSPANGDVVQVMLISNFPCLLAPIAVNNTTMTVIPVVQPIGYVNAVPGYIINQGAYDTFTVTIVSGSGLAPTYQWFKNSMPVAGATNTVFITNDLHTGDSINCVVTNNDQCSGVSTFNYINITVAGNVEVNTVASAMSLTLYPNPNSGTFILSGNTQSGNNEPVIVDIIDIMGSIVYHAAITPINGMINEPILINGNISSGQYLLRLISDNKTEAIRFSIVR